jgi:hypothetical protein
MASFLSPWLAAAAVLLLAAAMPARSVMRGLRAHSDQSAHGRRGRSAGPRDRTAVDRIEQDLRALDWLWRQGRISSQEYRRQREQVLRD